MIKQGIKNVIFDFGGILANLNRDRCIANFRKLGFDRIEELLNSDDQQTLFMRYEKGLISSPEFRDSIKHISPSELTDDEIDTAWNSILEDIPAYKPEALLKLRQKYNLYLLSNTNEIHWDWAIKHLFPYRNFGVNDYFARLFLSFEMKLAKPDPEIYRKVIEQTGIVPAETLFIDDTKVNCDAAECVGIAAYHAKPGEDWRHLFSDLL